jgi:CDP-diacylglycerol--glycerol-3-phosphate 3-phosphatidyltransferase
LARSESGGPGHLGTPGARALPWLLVAARAGATVVLAVGLATGGLSDRLVFTLFIIAFVSDYFDGVVARALGVVTPALRQSDSAVDTVFYLVLAGATWKLHREVLGRHVAALAICLATLGAWYLLDLFRWRAVAGFHAWSAKLFAAALGVWAVMLYGFGVDGPWLVVAAAAGTLSHLEGIAISLALRQHATDVPTVLHALRLRAGAAVAAQPLP